MGRVISLLSKIGFVLLLLGFFHWGFAICAIPFYTLAIVTYIIALIVKSIKKKVIKSAANIPNIPNAIALPANADIEDAIIVEECPQDISQMSPRTLLFPQSKQEKNVWEKGSPIPPELLFRWEIEEGVWSLITTKHLELKVSIKYIYDNEARLVEVGDEIVRCTTIYTDSPATTYITSPIRGICRYVGTSWYKANACMFKIYENEDYIREYLAEQERKAWQEREREKAEIARKLKEKQRKRDLEREVYEDLVSKGELFEESGRPPIPRNVRDVVWRRDGGRCVQCGSTQNLQFDHIIPFSKGGATTVENLQILCQKCNLAKSNKIG